MTNERKRKIYNSALVKASKAVVDAGGESVEEIIFPIWCEAVHRMMWMSSPPCPCRKGIKHGCFMEASPEARRELFVDSSLSFERFCSVIMEAWAVVSKERDLIMAN